MSDKLRIEFKYLGHVDINCSKEEWESLAFPSDEVRKRALDKLRQLKFEELVFEEFDFVNPEWVDDK